MMILQQISDKDVSATLVGKAPAKRLPLHLHITVGIEQKLQAPRSAMTAASNMHVQRQTCTSLQGFPS
eukprot:scaffold91962_cov16-Tisochrysis_lutea.AAC.1